MGKARRVRRQWKEKYEEQQHQAALIRSRQKRIVANLYAESIQDFLIKTYYTPLLLFINISTVIALAYRGANFVTMAASGIPSFILSYLLVSTLLSRIASSNWGTFHRDKQPFGFWISFSIIALAYLFFTAATFIMAFGTMTTVRTPQ